MGTIAEYKSRAAFNFERVSVLVNNMPTHDTDLCGRLRDHLAISVETADAKILAMATQQENHETRNEISTLVADLGQHIHQFRDKYEKARLLGADKTQQMLTDLNSEFANLGMREVQEDSIKGLVQTRADELIEIFDFSAETEETLNRLSNRLDNAISKSA
jgi:spore coat polysaccharide biosynthesis protein SpsF (cytidylyltransferase family)